MAAPQQHHSTRMVRPAGTALSLFACRNVDDATSANGEVAAAVGRVWLLETRMGCYTGDDMPPSPSSVQPPSTPSAQPPAQPPACSSLSLSPCLPCPQFPPCPPCIPLNSPLPSLHFPPAGAHLSLALALGLPVLLIISLGYPLALMSSLLWWRHNGKLYGPQRLVVYGHLYR